MAKWVYLFTEGDATMRNLLGGKGANLAEMTNIGLPVRSAKIKIICLISCSGTHWKFLLCNKFDMYIIAQNSERCK